ncbi:sigma-54 dependent transcriptional regulator [Asticcacaulis sp. EMRT-3]|uniref:sigma-54-dependent transcriptional regulator n=1 Tax=Asticcacaulis sp. EMRT-3 TaxID=3040349 RepID=UPI0024AEC648|nr:sigma-54 dependent transcriptional regulator [Asticcacaulis sp. EMRT-3]MDI7774280.1 sigma-54 dependent transcriptional regulator [Asticcacaulis sp. EMRT-3]
MAKTILICDDDPTQRRLIQAVLEREGFAALHAENGAQAYERLSQAQGIDAVILDLVMPGQSGIDTLKDIRAAGIRTPVVVLTASGGIDTVVKAMQAGAQDFFIKPASPERILVSVRNALQMGDLSAEVQRLQKRNTNRTSFDDLIGTSAAMQMVRRLGERAAKSNIPVLILGESGVGKELIARAIQGSSERAGKPFVAVNCGALPENLVESILFGHEKGSFTGASDKHLGKFQEASGGTLFLDEVGELPLDMQVKLLRALQEGEIDPVGSKRPVKVDVRIISATNRDLADQVRAGAFREDLFYRLNVFPVEALALRERRDDIPALIDHFIRRFNIEEGKRVTGVSGEAMQMLCAFDWPGNVRQLENTVYRAIVLSDSPYLQAFDFPAISGKAAPLFVVDDKPDSVHVPNGVHVIEEHHAAINALQDTPVRILDESGHLRKLDEIERDLIEHAIGVYAGHMSEVARRLGIGRSTLYRKVRDCGLENMVREAG